VADEVELAGKAAKIGWAEEIKKTTGEDRQAGQETWVDERLSSSLGKEIPAAPGRQLETERLNDLRPKDSMKQTRRYKPSRQRRNQAKTRKIGSASS
jgi:hypothetical protein